MKKYDAKEMTEKLKAQLDTMKAEQKPGQATGLVTKTEIVKALRADIEALMKAGYTAKQIADAMSKEDGFQILPKSITQYVSVAKPRRQGKPKQPKAQMPAKTTEQQGHKSFTISPDTEDL